MIKQGFKSDMNLKEGILYTIEKTCITKFRNSVFLWENLILEK